ncbi:hypothetical protein BV20DRAFT_75826 [Pilatotrama ljubarskyi]|nr:hypothetical protein BV20DRAFT_75826 [Pilatotrama ljubarskyi]
MRLITVLQSRSAQCLRWWSIVLAAGEHGSRRLNGRAMQRRRRLRSAAPIDDRTLCFPRNRPPPQSADPAKATDSCLGILSLVFKPTVRRDTSGMHGSPCGAYAAISRASEGCRRGECADSGCTSEPRSYLIGRPISTYSG